MRQFVGAPVGKPVGWAENGDPSFGSDHADGAPVACLLAGRADRIARPGGAR